MNEQKIFLVQIEFCKNCALHNSTTRHDQAKYLFYFEQIKKQVEENSSNQITVHCMIPPEDLVPANMLEGENIYFNKHTEELQYFPNLGAFEVYVNQLLISSKIISSKWPNIDSIVNTILQMYLKNKQNKDLSQYQIGKRVVQKPKHKLKMDAQTYKINQQNFRIRQYQKGMLKKQKDFYDNYIKMSKTIDYGKFSENNRQEQAIPLQIYNFPSSNLNPELRHRSINDKKDLLKLNSKYKKTINSNNNSGLLQKNQLFFPTIDINQAYNPAIQPVNQSFLKKREVQRQKLSRNSQRRKLVKDLRKDALQEALALQNEKVLIEDKLIKFYQKHEKLFEGLRNSRKMNKKTVNLQKIQNGNFINAKQSQINFGKNETKKEDMLKDSELQAIEQSYLKQVMKSQDPSPKKKFITEQKEQLTKTNDINKSNASNKNQGRETKRKLLNSVQQKDHHKQSDQASSKKIYSKKQSKQQTKIHGAETFNKLIISKEKLDQAYDSKSDFQKWISKELRSQNMNEEKNLIKNSKQTDESLIRHLNDIKRFETLSSNENLQSQSQIKKLLQKLALYENEGQIGTIFKDNKNNSEAFDIITEIKESDKIKKQKEQKILEFLQKQQQKYQQAHNKVHKSNKVQAKVVEYLFSPERTNNIKIFNTTSIKIEADKKQQKTQIKKKEAAKIQIQKQNPSQSPKEIVGQSLGGQQRKKLSSMEISIKITNEKKVESNMQIFQKKEGAIQSKNQEKQTQLIEKIAERRSQQNINQKKSKIQNIEKHSQEINKKEQQSFTRTLHRQKQKETALINLAFAFQKFQTLENLAHLINKINALTTLAQIVKQRESALAKQFQAKQLQSKLIEVKNQSSTQTMEKTLTQNPEVHAKVQIQAKKQELSPKIYKLQFTSIQAQYFKDFDTFGKMDPFLEFSFGLHQQIKQKTEVAQNAGLKAKWSKLMKWKDLSQENIQMEEINVKSFDQDMTENQFMGSGKMFLRDLFNLVNQKSEKKSSYKLSLIGKNNVEVIGEVIFNYEFIEKKIKIPEKNICFTDIKAKFQKSLDTLGNMKAFLTFDAGSESLQKTQVKSCKNSESSWQAKICFEKVRQDETNQVIINAYDEDITEDEIIGIGRISVKDLKQCSNQQLTIEIKDKENNLAAILTLNCSVNYIQKFISKLESPPSKIASINHQTKKLQTQKEEIQALSKRSAPQKVTQQSIQQTAAQQPFKKSSQKSINHQQTTHIQQNQQNQQNQENLQNDAIKLINQQPAQQSVSQRLNNKEQTLQKYTQPAAQKPFNQQLRHLSKQPSNQQLFQQQTSQQLPKQSTQPVVQQLAIQQTVIQQTAFQQSVQQICEQQLSKQSAICNSINLQSVSLQQPQIKNPAQQPAIQKSTSQQNCLQQHRKEQKSSQLFTEQLFNQQSSMQRLEQFSNHQSISQHTVSQRPLQQSVTQKNNVQTDSQISKLAAQKPAQQSVSQQLINHQPVTRQSASQHLINEQPTIQQPKIQRLYQQPVTQQQPLQQSVNQKFINPQTFPQQLAQKPGPQQMFSQLAAQKAINKTTLVQQNAVEQPKIQSLSRQTQISQQKQLPSDLLSPQKNVRHQQIALLEPINSSNQKLAQRKQPKNIRQPKFEDYKVSNSPVNPNTAEELRKMLLNQQTKNFLRDN